MAAGARRSGKRHRVLRNRGRVVASRSTPGARGVGAGPPVSASPANRDEVVGEGGQVVGEYIGPAGVLVGEGEQADTVAAGLGFGEVVVLSTAAAAFEQNRSGTPSSNRTRALQAQGAAAGVASPTPWPSCVARRTTGDSG